MNIDADPDADPRPLRQRRPSAATRNKAATNAKKHASGIAKDPTSASSSYATVDACAHDLIAQIGAAYIRPWYRQLSVLLPPSANATDHATHAQSSMIANVDGQLEAEVQLELRRAWLQLRLRLAQVRALNS